MKARFAFAAFSVLLPLLPSGCSTPAGTPHEVIELRAPGMAPLKVSLLRTLPFKAWDEQRPLNSTSEVGVKQKGRTSVFCFGPHKGTPFRVAGRVMESEAKTSVFPFNNGRHERNPYWGGRANNLWTVVHNGVQFCFYSSHGVIIRPDGTVEEFEILNPSALDPQAFDKLLIEPAREIERHNRENRVSAGSFAAALRASTSSDLVLTSGHVGTLFQAVGCSLRIVIDTVKKSLV